MSTAVEIDRTCINCNLITQNSHLLSHDLDSQTLNKLEGLFSFLKELNDHLFQKNLRSLVQECENKGVTHLLEVTTLDLSHCNLNELPSDFGLMQNIRYLRLIGNQLRDLPESLYSMVNNIRSIEIESNQFEELPRVVYRIITERQQNKLYMELYLRDNPMDIIPKSVKPVVCSLPHCGSLYSSWKGDFPHIFSLGSSELWG